MVPLQLELTNFLSYRARQALNLDGIGLAGISGQNGAGKSTLLEAMTWSLFGRSRSSSDDDVVNRIASREGERAEVRFTFRLEDSVYRVLRRKKKRGRMTLEFQLQRDADNWSTLSETRTRDTQATIERTLGMSYDTFINVSFFLQGQADEFTTRTAGKRKEILADLLGVNKWDAYRERASEVRKAAENDLLLLDAQVGEIDRELTEQTEREATLASLEAQLQTIRVRLEAQTALLNNLRQAAESARQQESEVKRQSQQLAREAQRLSGLQQTQQQRQKELDGYAAILAQRDDIVAQMAQYETTQADFERWQGLADEHNRLQQAMRPHELAIERELSRLTQLHKQLTTQQQQVVAMRSEQAQLQQRLARQREHIEALSAEAATIQQQETALHAARSRLQAEEASRRLVEQEAKQLRARSKQNAELVAEKQRASAEQVTAQTSITQLTMQVEQLSANREKLAALKTQQNVLRTMEQPRLLEQINARKDRINQIQQVDSDECPFCGQVLDEQHKAEAIAQIKKEGAPFADDWRSNKRKLAQWQHEITQLDTVVRHGARLEKDLEKSRRVEAQKTARLAQIERVLVEYSESGASERLAELTMTLADDDKLRSERETVQRLERAAAGKSKVERSLQKAQRELARMDARSAEISRIDGDWQTKGDAALTEAQTLLTTQQFEQAARAELATLRTQQAALGYSADTHRGVRQLRDRLRGAPKRNQGLLAAEAAVKPLRDGIASVTEQIEQQQTTVSDARREVEESRTKLLIFQRESADLKSTEDGVFQLRRDENEANRKVGFAQQRVAVLDENKIRRKALMTRRSDLTERIGHLQQLEKACGRDGIQAMLIERALPEIEDTANELLDRLTAGEMRVAFETQRQLKTSDALRETLDIHILDGSGERPYENYSGGEQFRINFAIRLALSKILSRRAGARLQTLVIDEGFGSQDPNGRTRLIEAIKMIEDDFACILVITHVEELRDAFPTRIEVNKAPDGSRVNLNRG